MTDEEVRSESRSHYQLNREGLALARQRLHELTDELLRVGVYGEASVTLKVTDGIIADVEVVKKTVERIRRRRRNSGRKPSLTGGGRQGDTPGKTGPPSDDERKETPSPSPDREGDAPGDET